MNAKNAIGRGGKPSKIVMRTEGGWIDRKLRVERAQNYKIAKCTRKALARCDAPDSVFARAFTIIRTYSRQLAVLDNPRTAADKNKGGVGRFKSDLRKRAEKMAGQLDMALTDHASHDLNSLINDGDLRSHMAAAYESLTAIVDLIDCAEDGITPLFSHAEVRSEAGRKLKALARENNLPMMDFVAAFGIYPTVGNGVYQSDAFNKWYQRLDG